MNRGPDFAALHRWIPGPVMAGDQEHDAIAPGNGLLEPTVDRLPRAVEAHAMEIERAIGLDRARTKAPVPACIERIAKLGRQTRRRRFRAPDASDNRPEYFSYFFFFFNGLRRNLLTRKRANARRHPPP